MIRPAKASEFNSRKARSWGPLFRFVNGALLGLLGILVLTGVYGLIWGLTGWAFDLHRVAAWALLGLTPWKLLISLRSLQRGFGRSLARRVLVVISLALSALVVIVWGAGLLWAWRLEPRSLDLWQPVISWHWMLGLALLPLLAVHAWRRWPRPQWSDFTARRRFLQITGLTAAAGASWLLSRQVAASREIISAPRRFTGSRGIGFFSGNDFPITNMLGEGGVRLDPTDWRLEVASPGRLPEALTYSELLTLPSAELIATLDCTSGWYTIQDWQGIWLRDLCAALGLAPENGGVRIKSVSDYGARFTRSEAAQMLLATHVGGEQLSHWHGFPLRAVVPSRRGWFWIKWIARIEVG